MTTKPSPLDAAIQKVGGNTRLAELMAGAGLRITPQAISQWDRVPADKVVLVSQLTGVPHRDLRPDLYPPTEAA